MLPAANRFDIFQKFISHLFIDRWHRLCAAQWDMVVCHGGVPHSLMEPTVNNSYEVAGRS